MRVLRLSGLQTSILSYSILVIFVAPTLAFTLFSSRSIHAEFWLSHFPRKLNHFPRSCACVLFRAPNLHFSCRCWPCRSYLLPSFWLCSRRVQLMQNSGWPNFRGNWVIVSSVFRVCSLSGPKPPFYVEFVHFGRTYLRVDSVLAAFQLFMHESGWPNSRGNWVLFPWTCAFVLC